MRKKVAYLRKSRADLELENVTGEDTLKRHRETIQKLAEQNQVVLERYYEEVVSGETIEARPKIKELLKEIENNKIEEVYVIDVDRLARGDTEDQGRISKTFKFGNTKIVTPSKVYDPNNEFDEEYFEFGLFMSRREYKIINRRLKLGRISSVNEGKFIGSICPYGYSKEKLNGQKGYKLVVDEEEAKVIKIIFDLGLKNYKPNNIANHLNKLGITTRKNEIWVHETIRSIIKNPVYYGMIRSNYRKEQKSMINGIIHKKRPVNNNCILVKGLHEPIIDEDAWKQVNENITNKVGKSTRDDLQLHNPLAGLVRCGVCGRIMQRRPYRSGHVDGLICTLPHCKNMSSHLYLVENAILKALQEYLKEYENILMTYKNEPQTEQINDTNIELIEKEILKSRSQLEKAYDLLEQGIYDTNTFLQRSNTLKSKIKELEQELSKYTPKNQKSQSEKIKDIIPKLEKVLSEYNKVLSIEEKNNLLKSVINVVHYIKTIKGRGHEDEFQLKIDIKL